MKDFMSIPAGCCELVLESNGESKRNCFKVNRNILENEPKKNVMINIFMEGSGFAYNGEIYHKSADYVYFYLY